MKTTKPRQRLALALIGAATIIGASACGTTGTTNNAAAAPATPGSTSSMDPGMGPSSMAPSTAATTGTPTSSTGTAAAPTIHIKSFAYSGPDRVPAGATVTVMNMDTEAHTLTADDGSFEAVVKAGTSVTFTAPAKPGAYPYHCTYHSNMQGTLTVK